MVNGPASGGEFPLGKEYWENQAKDERFVPKKTIKVPVGQTQQGEAAHTIEKKFSKKDIAKLLAKYHIEANSIKKLLAKNGEYACRYNQIARNSLERIDMLPQQKNIDDALAKIMLKIPAEDMENLTTKSDIIKYLKKHPELFNNFELENKPEESEVTKKLPPEAGPNSEVETEKTEETTPQPENENKPYVTPKTEVNQMEPQEPVMDSNDDVPDDK